MLFVDLESSKLQIEKSPIRLEDLVTSRKVQIDSDFVPVWYLIFHNDQGTFSMNGVHDEAGKVYCGKQLGENTWQLIFRGIFKVDKEHETCAQIISGLIKSIAITEFKPTPALGKS